MKRALRTLFANADLFIAAGVLAAVLAEAGGYHIADMKGGGNVLCGLDPTCRTLTLGERDLARGVFGDQIDYDTVRVFDRAPFLIPFNLAGPPTFVTHAGNIYDQLGRGVADFSREGAQMQSTFMHELTHIWEDTAGLPENGIPLRDKLARYEEKYFYDRDDPPDFAALNSEQRAMMVQTYVLAGSALENECRTRPPTPAVKEFCGRQQEARLKLGERLKPYLPLGGLLPLPSGRGPG